MGFTHGHLTAGGGTPAKKIENWWKGQMFGLNEAGDNPVGVARMIVHGHYHHFTAVQQGGRTIMGVPAMSPSPFASLRNKKEQNPWKKHDNIPL